MSNTIQIERPLRAIALGAQIIGIVTNASLLVLGHISLSIALPLIALNSGMLVWCLSWKSTSSQNRRTTR